MEILIRGKIKAPELIFVCPNCGTTFKINPDDKYRLVDASMYNDIHYYVTVSCPICKDPLKKYIEGEDVRRWKK